MSGLENIQSVNGFGIAATGMIIVFAALILISLFIYVLPMLLAFVEPEAPPATELQAPSRSSNDDEIAAAIGFALHQRDNQS